MNFMPSSIHIKCCANLAIMVMISTHISGQVTPLKDSINTKSNLAFYHSIAPDKNTHSFQRIDYSRPKNEFMSWPDYPLTATQLEQRNEKWKVDNKLPDIIVKDIVQSFLSKKKKVAVIPKF